MLIIIIWSFFYLYLSIYVKIGTGNSHYSTGSSKSGIHKMAATFAMATVSVLYYRSASSPPQSNIQWIQDRCTVQQQKVPAKPQQSLIRSSREQKLTPPRGNGGRDVRTTEEPSAESCRWSRAHGAQLNAGHGEKKPGHPACLPGNSQLALAHDANVSFLTVFPKELSPTLNGIKNKLWPSFLDEDSVDYNEGCYISRSTYSLQPV